MRKTLLTIMGAALISFISQAQIVITEIMYNPPESGTDSTEFIELYNAGGSSVDLQNYTFSSGVTFTFSSSTVVAAGGYAVVAVDAAAFQAYYGVAPTGQFSGALGNGGEPIALRDGSNALVDSVNYDDVAPWPVGFAAGQVDGGGASLMLCNTGADNNDGNNWMASTTNAGITINSFAVLASPFAADAACSGFTPTSVSFTVSTDAAMENVGVNDTLWVKLASPAVSTDSIYLSLSDISASYGVDYTTVPDMSSGTYTGVVSPGDSSIIIAITIINDTVYEGDETFTIQIDSVTDSLAVVSPSVLTYTIIEDDASANPVINFSSATTTVTEGDAPFAIAMSIAPSATQTDTIWVEVVNGAGVIYGGGNDYTIDSTIATDTFMIYINNGDAATGYNFTVNDDAVVESNEIVTFNIVGLSGALVLGSTLTHTVTIQDNDIAVIPTVSIVDIQTPAGGTDSSSYTGDSVLTGGIVTAVKTGTGYWIQESTGGPYSGIYVFDGVNTPSEGDSVEVKGTVDEFFGATQLESVTSFTNVSSGNAYVTTPLSTMAVNDEQYESVMISVTGAIVLNTTLGFGEYSVNDGTDSTIVDDFIFNYNLPTVGDTLAITGVMGYSFSNRKIFPRDSNDVVGATQNVGGGDASGNCSGATVNATYVWKDFEDVDLNSGGWNTRLVTGTSNWFANSFNGDNFAKISNFSAGANTAAENWLVSPSLDLSAASSPYVNFKTIAKFDGNPLQLMVSTNYSGTGNPNAATWADLTSDAIWDADMADWGDWVCSGDVTLSAYKQASVHVAFKYTGSDSNGSTWEVDDIAVFDGIALSTDEDIFTLANVFPNPVRDVLHVVLSKNAPSTIRILNVSGKVVHAVSTTKINNNVSVADMEAGMYIVQIISGNDIQSTKFIKK